MESSATPLALASPPPAPPDPEARAAVPVRIRHVDSLRAIAAGLVVWTHSVETFLPLAAADPGFLGFLRAVPKAVDIGRFGVMLFFAVSGFVICRSFGGPRAGATRRFLIKRFCRLYPAYWASMIGGLLVCWLQGPALTWPMLAANATMLPATLGQPRLLGVYWTLEIELPFYGLCLLLFWLRCLDRRAVLAACTLFLVSLPRLLKLLERSTGGHQRLTTGHSTVVLGLAMMFWGALFRMAYDETHGFRRGMLAHRGTWLVALLAVALIDVPDPNLKWALLGLRPGPVPTQFVVAGAVVVFAVWVAWLRVDQPILTYLGLISYSLYLFHPVPKYLLAHLLVVWEAGGGRHPPLWTCLLACAALSVALAMAAYRWVERPAIALGKSWAGRAKSPG